MQVQAQNSGLHFYKLADPGLEGPFLPSFSMGWDPVFQESSTDLTLPCSDEAMGRLKKQKCHAGRKPRLETLWGPLLCLLTAVSRWASLGMAQTLDLQ